jgi:hypothetical protein
MAAESLPTVTALVAAYNYERYVGEAIESALNQDYPAELLDVVVVDDGSQDGTAAVVAGLAERHPGRITLVRQENAGATAALNRARLEARGELLALLDADDAWLPTKISDQVQTMLTRPELLAVFCDMHVTDADGNVVRPLLGVDGHAVTARLTMGTPGQFAQLLWGNVATHSSLMVRAELFEQIPSEIPYADWWLALSAAHRSGLGFMPEPMALYRIHGANLTGGVTGNGVVREKVKSLTFRLWVLRHLELGGLSPSDTAFIWDQGVETTARETFAAAESLLTRLVEVDDEARAQADRCFEVAQRLRDDGDHAAEAVAILRSLAWNPYRSGGRALLQRSVGDARIAAERQHPLAGARAFVTIVDAEDLLSEDELLLAYADTVSGLTNATLAIDASRLSDRASGQLQTLVQRCGLAEREDVDMVAFVDQLEPAQQHRVRSRVRAVYGRILPPRTGVVAQLWSGGDVPVYTPETISHLRDQIELNVANAG